MPEQQALEVGEPAAAVLGIMDTSFNSTPRMPSNSTILPVAPSLRREVLQEEVGVLETPRDNNNYHENEAAMCDWFKTYSGKPWGYIIF